MSLPTPTLPSSAGAYMLSAGDFSVTLPTTISSKGEPIGGATYFEEIPGRNGLFATRAPVFLGRSLQLSGYIMDSDTVQALRRVVGQGRVTVTRGGRSLATEVVGLSAVETVLGTLWQITLDLESPNYYWSGPTQTTTGSPATVTNSGDLPSFPRFIVTVGVGGLASINFEVDGRQVEWTGNASENDILVIDCEDLTAFISTASELNNMNSSFFVNPVRFSPGTNTISTTINGAATFQTQHVELYL